MLGFVAMNAVHEVGADAGGEYYEQAPVYCLCFLPNLNG
jgi:hypothetical protein